MEMTDVTVTGASFARNSSLGEMKKNIMDNFTFQLTLVLVWGSFNTYYGKSI